MKNRIRILATSDIHGALSDQSYGKDVDYPLGLARCKTLIDSLKDENTFVIDNGDTIAGNALCFYESIVHQNDAPIVSEAMNVMPYDYINVGNHDFDFGETVFLNHINTLHAPCLTSNVLYKGNPVGVTYAIQEMLGKKLAFIGVTSHHVPHWEPKSAIRHFQFRDAYTTLKKNVETVKRLEHPDYIIVLYHGGFEKDLTTGKPLELYTGENQAYQMLSAINGIDVFIAGHQHRSCSGQFHNAAYTMTQSDGREIACVDIYTDTGVIEPKILPCNVKANPQMLSVIEKQDNECRTWLDTTIGTFTTELNVADCLEARLHKSQWITLINRVCMEKAHSDLAACCLYHHPVRFHKTVTRGELFSNYPYANLLVVKKISGKLLRAYLEQCAEYWSIDNEHIIVNPSYYSVTPHHYNYDMVDGVEYTITVSNDPGHRITSLTRNGVPVKDEDEFTIALNHYRANGGGNFAMLEQAPAITTYPLTINQYLEEWITSHSPVSFEPVNNITIQK